MSFYSLADVMKEKEVPLVMPKPVTVRDYEVRIRVPLEQARANQERLPLHFTNLQLGLRTARQMLARKGAANKQIFVITDGQPTAHVEPNPKGGEEMLHLIYPPSERTSDITLQEAVRCQQQGIRIATFALIEDYWGMDWVGFVEKLTRLTRGLAYYCTSENLSSTVIESYLSGKKTKSFLPLNRRAGIPACHVFSVTRTFGRQVCLPYVGETINCCAYRNAAAAVIGSTFKP